METSATIVRKPGEEGLARLMFGLSVLFLLLVAGIVHRHQEGDIHNVELQVQLAGLALLWPAFILEGGWRWVQRNRNRPLWGHLGLLLLIVMVPPLRIGVRSQADDRALWLPFLGWRRVDRELRRQLERFFSVPMILIALMVLPLLAIEYGWKEQVERYEALELFLAVSTAVIWFAFAIEFIIMVSVAKNKLLYSTTHWVDLAIIVLPLLQFLPLLRLLRIGQILRLEQLTRMGRLYRLQGLALKLWRAVLLLEVVQRITGQSLEKRMRKLQLLVIAKEEELEELRGEVADLQERIARQKQAETVSQADDGRRKGNEREIDHETEHSRVSDVAAGDGCGGRAGTGSGPGPGAKAQG